jgi:transposase
VVVSEAQRRRVHTVVLILDNGSTHAPARLEQWLRVEANRQGWRVCFIVAWLPVNASWLDQIEIWFSILQRKLLQPSHFTSTEDLERAIDAFIKHTNQTAKPLRWTYTVAKLEQKLGAHLR